MENFSNDSQDAEAGKTVAILSYITLIGWIIAIVMHNSNKTRFGAYHLRQGLGLFLLGVVLSFLSFGMGIFFLHFGFFWLTNGIRIIILVLMILGIINAVNLKKEPLPFVGELFNTMFSGIN
jgi:uncharacterized membrane protein